MPLIVKGEQRGEQHDLYWIENRETQNPVYSVFLDKNERRKKKKTLVTNLQRAETPVSASATNKRADDGKMSKTRPL